MGVRKSELLQEKQNFYTNEANIRSLTLDLGILGLFLVLGLLASLSG